MTGPGAGQTSPLPGRAEVLAREPATEHVAFREVVPPDRSDVVELLGQPVVADFRLVCQERGRQPGLSQQSGQRRPKIVYRILPAEHVPTLPE